jgi:hypothetical protein
MNNSLMNLDANRLRHAATLKEKIDKLTAELNRLTGDLGLVLPKRKHKMSAAGRAAIVAAQKKRWAKIKTGK